MKEEAVLSDIQFDELTRAVGKEMREAVATGARDAFAGEAGAVRKAFFAPGESGENTPAERTQKFFKAVLGGDHLVAKALAESTDSLGGYLVPQGFRDEVIMRLPETAELAPYVRVVPVLTDTGSLPSLATDISVSWNAAADSENVLFGETSPVFGSVAWALKRADAFTKISRELVSDSAPAVVDFVTTLFREAISRERDRVIAVGDGSSEPTGLVNASGVGAVAVSDALSFDSLVEIEQTLARKYRRNARWIMNGANLQQIYSLKDSQNRPLFVRDMVGGVPESRILGYPVSQIDDLDDDTVMFGDLSHYLWFDRGEMGIESTNTGGDAFAKHQTWIKVWERVDGKLALPESFVKATITAS